MHSHRSDTKPTGGSVQLVPTETTQQALHEAIGHLYDAVATEALDDEPVPDSVFEDLESMYVAAAEAELSELRIEYTVEPADDGSVDH